jgi:hypothetical protein
MLKSGSNKSKEATEDNILKKDSNAFICMYSAIDFAIYSLEIRKNMMKSHNNFNNSAD